MGASRNIGVSIESQGTAWDHVRVWRIAGREAISELFSWDVDVFCDAEHDLPDGTGVGERVTLVITHDGDEVRRIHGAIGAVRKSFGAFDDHLAYRLRVVPRAAALGAVETQEIFLGKTVPEIIQSKLERHDLTGADVDLRLLGTYPKREFVVQYKETDAAFVSRLAEQAGISFFFEHDGDSERLVITDQPSGFRVPEGAAGTLAFQARGESSGAYELERVEGPVPTSYIEQDYNYRSPLVDLSGVYDLETGTGGGVVEFGAHVKTPEEAQALAKVRAEERRADQLYYEGKAGSLTLSAGQRVTLADVPGGDGDLVVVASIETTAVIPLMNQSLPAGTPPSWSSSFRLVPASFTYRPRRRTPKPVAPAAVTGVIQPGAEGETGGVAQLDADGRYLVQFHFDTAAPGQAKASHRIRLAQPFSGAGYGMHFPLRRGTEVLVAFTNGDLDRPVIVGALYNAASPSPVVAQNANTHQITTSSGISLEFGAGS